MRRATSAPPSPNPVSSRQHADHFIFRKPSITKLYSKSIPAWQVHNPSLNRNQAVFGPDKDPVINSCQLRLRTKLQQKSFKCQYALPIAN
jgi:hypothetical protein